MANWKKVDADKLDADLTSVADAIRERSGTAEELNFPDGFVSAVEGIPDSSDMLKGLIERKTDLQIIFPEGLTKIHSYAFADCTNVYFPEVVPEGITSIGYYAFFGCHRINRIILPSSLTSLDNWAFVVCNDLQTVTFKGKPTMRGKPFDQCPKLTTINVPWAEGEVTGAPWGATSATINYNYNYTGG